MSIAASALYLLAAPSTPSLARIEVFERATQREVITHTLAKAIVERYKGKVKSKVAKTDIIDVPVETIIRTSSTPTRALTGQSLEVFNIAKEQFDEQLTKEIKAPKYSQVSSSFHETTSVDNSSDHLKAQTEMLSPFGVGKQIFITDEQQRYKWLGEVVKFEEVTANDIEVVIKI